MKAYLKQYNQIYKTTIVSRLFAVVFLLGIATGIIYILFNNETDVLSLTFLMSFTMLCVIVNLYGISQLQRYNYLSIFPIKTDIRLKALFLTGEKSVMVFYSSIIIISLFKADLKIILLEAILMCLIINICYITTDGTDRRKQEFKIVSFIVLTFGYGLFGGTTSVVINKIVESKNDTFMTIIMSSVLGVLVIVSVISRSFFYKKFKRNILCMNNK